MGDHIRAARIINGLTQQELAEQLGCTRQYIHQIENGGRLISDHSNLQFMKLLKLREDYSFYNISPHLNVNNEDLNFCRRKGATIAEIERARIVTSIYADFVEQIENWINFPKEVFTQLGQETSRSNIDKLALEKLAERVRFNLDLGIDAPISNMIRVAEKQGAIVTRMPAFSEKISAFSVAGKRPLIALNETGNATRSRFKLAHEIGHLILHVGLETGCSETEHQADNFAGALLMPRSVFKKEFLPLYREFSKIPFNWSGIFELKQRWKVSVQAIIYRAFYLNFISENDFGKAYKYLSKNGFIKSEKGDEEIVEEKPEILKASLDIIYKKKGITYSHLIGNLPYQPELLQDLFGLENLACKEAEKDNIVLFRKIS